MKTIVFTRKNKLIQLDITVVEASELDDIAIETT